MLSKISGEIASIWKENAFENEKLMLVYCWKLHWTAYLEFNGLPGVILTTFFDRYVRRDHNSARESFRTSEQNSYFWPSYLDVCRVFKKKIGAKNGVCSKFKSFMNDPYLEMNQKRIFGKSQSPNERTDINFPLNNFKFDFFFIFCDIKLCTCLILHVCPKIVWAKPSRINRLFNGKVHDPTQP